ncbi:unnamed protein product [Prunus brigantina]
MKEEDIAHKCLIELVDRCLVQVGRNGSTSTIKTCQGHDLIRDLCLLKAEEENEATNPFNSDMVAKSTPLGKVRRRAIFTWMKMLIGLFHQEIKQMTISCLYYALSSENGGQKVKKDYYLF